MSWRVAQALWFCSSQSCIKRGWLTSACAGTKPSWTARLLADPKLLCKKVRCMVFGAGGVCMGSGLCVISCIFQSSGPLESRPTNIWAEVGSPLTQLETDFFDTIGRCVNILCGHAAFCVSFNYFAWAVHINSRCPIT